MELTLILRGALEDEHPLCRFLRRERRAQRRVAAADDDNVPVLHHSTLTCAFCTTSFQRACSLAMKSANSFEVEPTASALSGSSCFSSAALFAALADSKARRFPIESGSFAGPISPYHCEVSNPG